MEFYIWKIWKIFLFKFIKYIGTGPEVHGRSLTIFEVLKILIEKIGIFKIDQHTTVDLAQLIGIPDPRCTEERWVRDLLVDGCLIYNDQYWCMCSTDLCNSGDFTSIRGM